MSLLDSFNDYGGFGSQPVTAGTVQASTGGAMVKDKTGRWYDGLADSFGSLVDTTLKVGVPILAANAKAKADASLAKAQARTLNDQIINRPGYTAAPATLGGYGSGIPMWAIYAGAAVVGVVVLVAITNAARK